MGQECTTAAGWRECGNVHYASADFSSASNTWRFWVGYNDPDNDEDNDYSVFYEPVDPEELPMIVVDGVPIWPMREGLPLDLSAIKQVTCIPDSLAHACAFVNMVVENLRARDAD